jgi:hypothetical protein
MAQIRRDRGMEVATGFRAEILALPDAMPTGLMSPIGPIRGPLPNADTPIRL